MVDIDSIISIFEEFIKKYKAENCYVGITDNYDRRFQEHKVTDSDNKYSDHKCDGKWGNAGIEENASKIEQLFLNKYKSQNIQGGDGGGKGKSKFVYIYKIVLGVTDEEA